MKKLETERLFLKLYTNKDKKDFINLMTDKKVMEKVGDGVLNLEAAEKLWIKLTKEFYPNGIETIWAVFTKEEKRYIGHASLRPRPEKKDDWEIGYFLKTREWGKGFATEIARRLIEFGFTKLDLPEIFATIDDDNFVSIKVAEKAGMRFKRFEYDEQGRFSVYSVKR